jgi:ABC-type Fe3+/spermidine/putrescine transport system ATPase subunit
MIQARNIYKSYEGKPLLKGITFSIVGNECICLLGPSGSGKSTLLRILAGLEKPESGQVLWDETDLADIPAHLRDFGLVFQDYALFPHLNVYANIAFGLRMKQWTAREIDVRVAEILDLVKMTGFEKRNVTELSGGEQQRVALARALAPRPRLLMFDEPLGALDRSLREDLLDEIRSILRTTAVPAIYVTHDQDEAFTISERILILHEGKIVRDGSPVEISKHPDSVWAAEFLGLGNILKATFKGQGNFETELGIFQVDCQHKHMMNERVHLLARPNRSLGEPNRIHGSVTGVSFQQDKYRVSLDNGTYIYLADAPTVGTAVELAVKVDCLGG